MCLIWYLLYRDFGAQVYANEVTWTLRVRGVQGLGIRRLNLNELGFKLRVSRLEGQPGTPKSPTPDDDPKKP